MASTPSVLLVDGETSTREAVRHYLAPFCEVVCVTSGRQGRDVLRRSSVGLTLVEANLPDRSELEFLREIRREYPRLPVIVVTGFGSEALCAEAFRMGVRDYFPKPVNPVALAHSVRSLLARREAEPAPALDEATTSGLHTALRYVHEHYCEKLSLADVANVARVGYFTTSRMFRTRLGVSFQTYLHRLRIDQAKRLLTQTESSVASIGPMVGFGDLSRFNKSFRKCAGMTPTEYRRLGRARDAEKKSTTA